MKIRCPECGYQDHTGLGHFKSCPTIANTPRIQVERIEGRKYSGLLWIDDDDNSTNFKFNIAGGDFASARRALKRFIAVLQQKLNLTGQRFGQVTAIKYDHRDAKGRLVWLCHCDCGRDCYFTVGHLTGKFRGHCGCLKVYCQKCERWFAGHRFSVHMSQSHTPEYDALIERAWEQVRSGLTVIEVPLSNLVNVALIDAADAPLVLKYRWKLFGSRGATYAESFVAGDSLHRFLLKPPSGLQVDHKNGNGLDCRRSNLRLATHSQNQQNKRKNPSSIFKGVTDGP